MQSSETKFARIFESGKYLDMLELSDASLQTDDGCNFDIHRLTLAMSSDFFRRLFLGHDKRRGQFHIPGISGECLSDILCYVYTGYIRVTERNAADLMIGADYLLMKDLQMKIKYNIKANLNEVNCLRILRAAHQIGDEDIFRKCFRFVQTRFEGVMRCQKDDLGDLPLDILGRILSNRSLCVYNETTVWQAIVAWTLKDIPHRMKHVSQLLLTLAVEDIGEDLAMEILQHEIISENFDFMDDLVEITSSNDFTNYFDLLLTFLRRYWNCSTKPILRHRVPHQLLVVHNYFRGGDNLYITYDENADLFRKITGGIHWPDVLIAMGHNIYKFAVATKMCICMKFDLSAMDWVRMENFAHNYSDEFCIVATDAHIYFLGKTRELETYDVEVYDTTDNKWRKGVPPRNISRVAAVVIGKNIFAVGVSASSRGLMTQMFDPDTQQWSIMTPPTVCPSQFSLVAYHGKMYLIGGSGAEVYDPATNLWKGLPSAFGRHSSPKAVVINDQIIVCDIDGYDDYVGWNDAEECWKRYDSNFTLKGLFLKYTKFCTVDDVPTIKMIMKQNRDFKTLKKYRLLF